MVLVLHSLLAHWVSTILATMCAQHALPIAWPALITQVLALVAIRPLATQPVQTNAFAVRHNTR